VVHKNDVVAERQRINVNPTRRLKNESSVSLILFSNLAGKLIRRKHSPVNARLRLVLSIIVSPGLPHLQFCAFNGIRNEITARQAENCFYISSLQVLIMSTLLDNNR
jgi:hypothetical protein